MIVYAWMTVLWADVSFAWHPSLWFGSSWQWIVGPLLVWLAAWMTGASFRRFFGVMQYRQSAIKGWRKVGRVLLYGVCAPALSYTIAALGGADVAHAIPKPVEGDWKIAVGIAGTIIAIAVLSSAISKLRRTEIYQ